MKTNQPLLDYLATCSEVSLQSFELARLNDVANLRQQLLEQMLATVDQIVEADIQARLAQWVCKRRRTSRRSPQRVPRNRETRERQYVLPVPVAAGDPPKSPSLPTKGFMRLAKPIHQPTASQHSYSLKLASAGSPLSNLTNPFTISA